MCPKEHEQKATTEPARKEKKKKKENERSSRRASMSRSKTTPLRVEKKWTGTYVQVVGPQKTSAAKRDRCGIAYLDGPSEIRTGSPGAWTRHRNGSKHPVLFISMPGQRRPLPCLG